MLLIEHCMAVLEILNFSSRVQKYFTRSSFQQSKRNFVSPRGHLIFTISSMVFSSLYYYMSNLCNLIGLEQWYFSLI